MKFKKVNGKFFLIAKDGSEVEVTEAQVEGLEEVTEETPAPKKEGEAELEPEAQEALQKFIKKSVGDQAKEVVSQINAVKGIGAEMKKALSDAFAGSAKKSSLDTDAIVKGLTGIKGKQGASFDFHVKTLSELNSLTGDVIVPEREAGITDTPMRTPIMESLADVGGTASNKVSWVEVLAKTGAPATTAELEALPARDYTFAAYEASVLKIGAHTKQSNEILEDAPALVAAVREMLSADMSILVDDKLYAGAGTAGEFTGVKTIATAFTTTIRVETPTYFDVLRAALAQIEVAGKGKYIPTAILMNVTDVARLDLTKDINGNYVLPPFTTADRTVIKGVKVIGTTLVTEGDFLVGDFTKLHMRNRRGLTIQVATENSDDFVKDLITLRVTRRFAVYAKNNDSGAFVKGTFGAAVTLMTAA